MSRTARDLFFRISTKAEVAAWGIRGELLPSPRTDGSPLPNDRIYLWKHRRSAKAYGRHLYTERKQATGFTLGNDLVIVGLRMDPTGIQIDPDPSEAVRAIGDPYFTVRPISWSSVISTEGLRW